MNPHLFVYGSLIRDVGHPMGERLRREAALVGPARMQGRLYRVSWYPGAVAGSDAAEIVHGEVYRLADAAAALAWLDEYEGLAAGPTRVAASEEFVRTQVPVVIASGARLDAWVYLYRRDVARLARVADGRWRAP